MKTKQAKEEPEKSTDDDSAVEPKTRARKKADEEDKNKANQDDPKTSKEPKKNAPKPKALIKKKPLGIRKALRSKKAVVSKDAVKKVIKQASKRGRKPRVVKTEPTSTEVKDEIPMIPVSEIKKEPVEETTPNSRSSSPRGPGRRPRLSSDVSIMKSVLSDSSCLIVGPRTSPYSMRSERSNSPSLNESKNLRRGNPRKAKALLNEVVIKEQKKRRRLLSDSKVSETEGLEDCKKLKRGRSCSRDGSEISKCSDITESDLSLSESLNDTDSKELKKLDKAKTELDIENENNVQISTNEKVPSIDDSKLAESKPDAEPSFIPNEKTKKSLGLKRSSSLDSDNNNSNRLKLENFNSSDVGDKSMVKTENDTLFEARSSILNSMSKTFNSKEVSKNMRKARRGRKAAAATRTNSTPGIKNGVSTALKEDDKQETLESLSKEIDDLINNLDQNIDGDCDITNESNLSENSIDQLPNKSSTKPVAKALTESNIIVAPETPVKDKETISITTESTPSKIDDSENIRLHYEEDSSEKNIDTPKEITYKHTTVASIDKLMDRLKEFEEFDKRRQRQESESKSSDSKPVMVTNDVVLIPKSGADIKPLKDIQTVRSPERPMQKENLMSCFENNSAISLLKRDHARKSVDVDLPNSVTLIKRNSISARKESTSSNHSKETDAISIFEKSLGKDVTLTEIRKSVDKTPTTQVDIHQFATLHPNNSTQGVVLLDSNQVSLLPRVSNDVQITKRNSRTSRESLSRKSSESGQDEAMATLEKIKSPPYQSKSMEISITPNPVAIKSPETEIIQPIEAEALAPPLDSVKNVPDDIVLTSKAKPEVSVPVDTEKVEGSSVPETPEIAKAAPKEAMQPANDSEIAKELAKDEKMEVDEKPVENAEIVSEEKPETTPEDTTEKLVVEKAEATVMEKPEAAVMEKPEVEKKPEDIFIEKSVATPIEKLETIPVEKTEATAKEAAKPEKPARASKGSKSARNSIESQPGPSNALHETPESQKRKENVLRTLGLLTHKAAKEAKIEKAKEKERIYSGLSNKKSSKPGSGDYTGTLKTVIKLNRGAGERDKKRYRSSLKMTFKTKNRGKLQPEEGQELNDDDTYYTIERREGGVAATSEGGHRKSYSNRLNNHDGEAAPEPEPKETLNLVIPEKASSFSIHPGRLCMDQCFYCGGKFGLFDTPCHIAQMKSAERQKKVLANEEKLTIDSCLCDACYRHVDRRANCPSYRKRPAKLIEMPMSTPQGYAQDPSVEKLPVSPPEQDESEEEQESNPITVSGRPAICHATGCAKQADHSIRRKWLIKMRASVNKLVKLEGDYPGLHTLPLCSEHYRALLPLLACALCRRRITRHHNVHLLHNFLDMNPLLAAEGIPVSFAEKPALCKLCRYYCSLLAKSEPGQLQQQQPHHRMDYRRKLLQIYNIELPPEPPTTTPPSEQHGEQSTDQAGEHSGEQSGAPPGPGQGKKKNRGKWKVRGDINIRTDTEQDRVKGDDNEDNRPIEEDIESLISSNKILVPGAKPSTTTGPTAAAPTTPATAPHTAPDQSVYDFEPPPALDKQTELQYLLQKQNNPAQFLHRIPDLTKVGKSSKTNAIQKPGQQQRISDKNAKRIQKIGQIFAHKDRKEDGDVDMEKAESMVFKNMPLNDECTIETIPTKKPADIDTLKNKWQMSESFTQVKKNLSELSKKLTVEKDPKKSSVKYLNPVKRLETNPSISVRELFPGEEEMNLQCSIEFNNVKAITPEGWEKCNTTIQYDLETKKLWNELQRPYGNQSSFLRHLILLEKYFRSGDLVLSSQARPHAVGYSESVQSRLRAYDNVVTPPHIGTIPKRQETSISLVEYRKRPTNGKSLLRSNRHPDNTSSSTSMPPPPTAPLPPPPPPPPPLVPTSSKKHKDRPKKQLPPELIAINAPRKAIQSVLHNIQQLVRGVSAADPTELARTDPPHPPTPPPPAYTAPTAPTTSTPATITAVTAPDTEPTKDKTDSKEKTEPAKEKSDTPKEKKEGTVKKKNPTSKPWRPTLMPITPENVARIAREPTQTAVDGRQLPSLVQVMSSGKRYHITLQDYNKMCVMRREKLQQLQQPDKKDQHNATVTEVQTSAMLGNGGTVVQKIMDKEEKPVPELTQISSNAATILKNVGLKNITIAPIPPKTATMTSHTCPSPVVTSPALSVTSAPLRLPQLPAVSITSEAVIMPKIPKSLTVIPQTVMAIPNVVSVSQSAVSGPFVAVSQGAVVPVTSQAVVSVVPQAVVPLVQGECARP